MAAGGMLAMEGLNSAIEDPSAGNIAMAGLGAVPFARPLKGLVKGAQEAKALRGIRNTYGAGDMGAAFGREAPYRMGAGAMAQAAKAPEATTSLATRTGTAFSPGSMEGLNAATGKAASTASRNPAGSVNDMMTNQRGLDFMHREAEANAPTFNRMAERGDFGVRNQGPAQAKRGAFNRQTPEVVEAGPSMEGQVEPSAGAVDEMLAALTRKTGGLTAFGDEAATAAAPATRPAGDFVHAADTSGGAFGFDELPEISESELTRLQNLFKRLGR